MDLKTHRLRRPSQDQQGVQPVRQGSQGTQPRNCYPRQKNMSPRPHRSAPTSAHRQLAPVHRGPQAISPIHRGPQAMNPANIGSQHHAPNAALLIDFDNVTMGIRSELQTELKNLLSSDIVKGKVLKKDAWELVTESITRMKRNGDVMRADRLKQVMQQIDSSFDEKNLGMSKFSRFVTEAAQRGLLTLTKLENGQLEVGPPGAARTLPAGQDSVETPSPRAAAPAAEGDAADRPRRSPRGGRGRDRQRRGPRTAPAVARIATDSEPAAPRETSRLAAPPRQAKT